MRIRRRFIANEALLAVVTRWCCRDSVPHLRFGTGRNSGPVTVPEISRLAGIRCVASQRVRPCPAGSQDSRHHSSPKLDSRHLKAPPWNRPGKRARECPADAMETIGGSGNLGICRQGDLLHRPSSCPITRRWGRGHQRTALSAVAASLIAFPSPGCPELGIIRKGNHTNGAWQCERAEVSLAARPAKHG